MGVLDIQRDRGMSAWWLCIMACNQVELDLYGGYLGEGMLSSFSDTDSPIVCEIVSMLCLRTSPVVVETVGWHTFMRTKLLLKYLIWSH